MGLTGTRTYVGFGFGAIQAGLFLYEAFMSGNFRRLVVAEVLPDLVAMVRAAGGHFSCNIAHSDRVEHVRIGPIEILNPAQKPDRERLIEAIAEAEEMGTAIPSVKHYVTGTAGSVHRVLAQGLREKAERYGPRAVVYTAENHNRAAEILGPKVMAETPENEQDAVQVQVRFLNTVIAKMSGVASIPHEMKTPGLVAITPQSQRAFLVEVFNRILISKIRFDDRDVSFQRGIDVFEEKEDLLPFEEAKLFGHNATHALAAYVGAVRGVQHIAHLREIPGIFPFLRGACIEESGAALVLKHAGIDPLFTRTGYRDYADDLLARMTNPFLRDTVERVGRDPERKLGWDDRLIGTIRMALRQGVTPHRYAFGVAAALWTIDHTILHEEKTIEALLTPLWRGAAPETAEQEAVVNLVNQGFRRLRRWRASGSPELERFFEDSSQSDT